MTSEQILRSDVLDIVFENRNKSYGAYELRKCYPKRLATAALSSISVIGLALFFFSPHYKGTSIQPSFKEDTGMVVHTFRIPPETPPPPPPRHTPTAATAPQIQHVTIRIAEDPDMTDVPERGALAGRVIAGTTADGDPAALPQVPVPAAEEVEPAAAAQPFVPSYIAPEFPGGLSAWMYFLNRHLQVPESLGGGEKKSLIVRFLVGTDGSVSGLEVVTSAGAAFDSEVIRVLKKMPRWKPALQNGQPVARTFTQPVTL